jgi:NADH-quinone oxidoreductase subunit G
MIHAAMEQVTLTIDGAQVTVPKGTSVLQAAISAGIQVPYYCYHPGLGIDASCRVCLVKIEKMGKLQTSCSTPAAEGMVVHTKDAESTEARAGVFEFLLINHPLDCPVCDKGGECPLQDFSYEFGNVQSRMDFPRRTFDGEGVKADVDFGPTLMLNRNRCIMCTRCARFMDEVDGDAQIGVINRGNGSEIGTFNEQGVHSLLSGNLMDVCPVGAITTKQYRFRSRPWDNPNAIDTVCTGCSKGCATTAWLRAKPEWAKGSQLVRVTPRFNPAVNGYWMCDIGRFQYGWVEGPDRLRKPQLRTKDGAQQTATWKDALTRVRDLLNAAGRRDPAAVRFLVSAHASLEELFLVKRVATELKGDVSAAHVAISWRRSAKAQPANTKFHVPATDAPNVTGARDLGLAVGAGLDGTPDLSGLRASVESGLVDVLYVVDPGPAESLGEPKPPARSRRSSTRVCSRARWPRRPMSCCPAPPGSRRTAASRTIRACCRPRRRPSSRPVKRWKTGRSSRAWRRPSACRSATNPRPLCASSSRRRWPASRSTKPSACRRSTVR